MRATLCGLLLLLLPAAHAQPVSPDLLRGLSFRTIGPATMSGRIVDLAVVEKDPYTFYVASATGGLWKTTNNGVTFEAVFEDEATHSIGDVAVHQRADSVVWVGTGERANRQSSSWGNGLYRSTDGGKTWTHIGLDDTHHIGRIALHPDNPDVAYVAALGHLWGPNAERGLYKTSDGGQTWARLLFIDEDTGVVDVAMDPGDPNTLYAAAYQRRRRPYGFHGGGPGSGLYKSTDGGQSWRRLTTGLPEGDVGRIGISIYRSNPSIVYVSVEQGWQYNASTAYGERRAGVYRSDDRGETWTHQSDWNPRPMYASQILVDPTDDQRVYMMNAYSYSDDGGQTFRRARQSLHGDDRILWVNPEDGRHVMKGDDGGLGLSYDRGQTWLYITHLPVSQFYRISVDMRTPYWVYGGLQDNGSWMGPSATYRSRGILNEDWIKTGGGDGFVNLIDPDDKNSLYVESQYLGLSRLDLHTRQRRAIRPGDPKGHIAPRRNWDAWGPDTEAPELGNAMAPANWDGPFLFSPHDPNTLYAGTNILWKSTDGGDAWTALGDLTTGVNRRHLAIMGQVPHDSTLSLDDGIPYYPTLTAIAESPLREGRLYVGTDDGNLHVSDDGGQTWTEVSRRLPGLPDDAWINGLEPSRFDAATVYAVANNYRNDDFANYVYASTDAGQSWTAITGDLPADRVARTLCEDPRTPGLLYLGTELGLFITFDGGQHWTAFKNNLPTVAVNDLVIHPRDNDLVLGTHGRGIWILDHLKALQEMTPAVRAADAHLFSIPPAEMIRYSSERGHAGDMIFYGQNPPRGAVIDYYLRTSASPTLTIHGPDGTLIRTLTPDTTVGINRITWNLRHADLPAIPADTLNGEGDSSSGPSGPRVAPGRYTARLTLGETTHAQTFTVHEDPRLDVSPEVRKQWAAALWEVIGVYEATLADAKKVLPVQWQIEKLQADKQPLDATAVAEVKDLHRQYTELLRRIRSLYFEASAWTGPLTDDQQQQLAYYRSLQSRLQPEANALGQGPLRRLNRRLPKSLRITFP